MSQIKSYFCLLFSATGRTKIIVAPLCLVDNQGRIQVRCAYFITRLFNIVRLLQFLDLQLPIATALIDDTGGIKVRIYLWHLVIVVTIKNRQGV